MQKGSVISALLLVSGYNKWILYNSYKKTNANANAKVRQERKVHVITIILSQKTNKINKPMQGMGILSLVVKDMIETILS